MEYTLMVIYFLLNGLSTRPSSVTLDMEDPTARSINNLTEP